MSRLLEPYTSELSQVVETMWGIAPNDPEEFMDFISNLGKDGWFIADKNTGNGFVTFIFQRVVRTTMQGVMEDYEPPTQ